MKTTAIAAIALLLAGCAASAQTLLVMPTTAIHFYDAPAIVYSRSPGLRSYYRINSWTERPSHRIGRLLTDRLAASGAFASVVGAEDGVRGTQVLATRLEELYHDASSTPGTVRIVLTAVLTHPALRAVVGQRRFTASAPAPTEDAAGAVRGIAVTLGPLLDEVVAWTATTAARPGTDAFPARTAANEAPGSGPP
jgi:cholesterol transport system auxiliary component